MSEHIISDPNLPQGAISFRDNAAKEMLRVAPDGFYVRGVKLEQDEREARAVYAAFTDWMVAVGALPPKAQYLAPDGTLPPPGGPQMGGTEFYRKDSVTISGVTGPGAAMNGTHEVKS